MKYRLLWQLLSNYRAEHTLISLIGTCHCIGPSPFARPTQWHCWFCKFWLVGRFPEFILAGNFVHVGLLLIPRKKQNLTTQNTICRGKQQDERKRIKLWFVLWDSGFFSHMFLHKIPTVLHFTHIGQWGIAPTGTLLVTDASEMLHTSSLGDRVGVQTLTSRTVAWNGQFINTL